MGSRRTFAPLSPHPDSGSRIPFHARPPVISCLQSWGPPGGYELGWAIADRPPQRCFPLLRRNGAGARPKELLFVFDVYVLGVDYAFVFLRSGFCCRLSSGGSARGSCGVGLIEDFGQFVAGGGQLLVGRLQRGRAGRT